jgi:hypothetical protein
VTGSAQDYAFRQLSFDPAPTDAAEVLGYIELFRGRVFVVIFQRVLGTTLFAGLTHQLSGKLSVVFCRFTLALDLRHCTFSVASAI